NINPGGGDYAVWAFFWNPQILLEAYYDVNSWVGTTFSVAHILPPSVITNLAPVVIETGQAGFSWNSVPDADWYQIWVGEQQADNSYSTHHLQWYAATDLGCPAQDICQITLP